MRPGVASLAIGTALALALFGLGYVAMEAGAVALSYALYWQAWLLQVLTPCVPVPFASGLLCENRAFGMTLFYAGIPLGAALYSLAAYAMLRRRSRRTAAPPTPA